MRSYNIVMGVLLGWLVAIIIGECFVGFTNRIQKKFIEDIRSLKKFKFPRDKWENVVDIGSKLSEPTKWLGRFEVTIFYFCLFNDKPEGIGVWLAFKLAAKWEAWANIIKIPNKIKNIGDLDYLGIRNRFATVIMQKFLIGTIGNILAALIGMGMFCIIKCLLVGSN